MALPEFTMQQLLEAGVHFGHHARRWNPKMREYIFGVRNGVHIIDLQQTQPMLAEALKAIRDIVAGGGRVLFVGTKRQAQQKIVEAAKRSGQYYVNHRWLGGMLTNWQTITKSINRLRELENLLGGETSGYTKKEMLMMNRERNRLEDSIGGIKEMGGQPDALFVLDTTKEDIAILEANKLRIPVIAVVDTNAPLDGVDYVIPGNDDALRAIDLYCDLVADAILDGLQAEMAKSKVDTGAAVDVKVEVPKVKLSKAKDEPSAEELETPGEKAKKEADKKQKAKTEDTGAADAGSSDDDAKTKKAASA